MGLRKIKTKKVKSGDWIRKINSNDIYVVSDKLCDGDYSENFSIIKLTTGNFIKYVDEIIDYDQTGKMKLSDSWEVCNNLKKLLR